MIHKTVNITTHSPEETHRLGKHIGAKLISGSIIAFTGDLGSGKTTFIQGLARGLDVPRDYHITSPTYTLINEYPGRHIFFHVDLYRLEGPGDFEDIGLYDILDSEGVVAIEWADRLDQGALSEHIRIISTTLGETSRKFSMSAYGENAMALIEGI